MTSGRATAAARMRRVSMSRKVIAGGDSSSTGNSVQADIDHSEVISVPLGQRAGRGQQQRCPECGRRQPAVGRRPATSCRRALARLGRAAASTMITGIAT